MKKTLAKGMALAFAGSLFVAGSALALPWDSLSSDYIVSTNMDYWTVTDLTTNVTGTSLYTLVVEQAAYESNFGLYTIDSGGNLAATFEIFARTDEPSGFPATQETVTFWYDSGTYKVTKSFTDDNDFSNDNWTAFDDVFGFYYEVYNPNSYLYTFYTDSNLNTADVGVEHITTAYNPNTKNAYIFLEDLLAANADWDWTDMTVHANDVEPIPEPATMLLMGTGLAGLAGVARRRKKA